MKRLCEKIADGWVLNSIENMLRAGIMKDGVLHKSVEGVPQGGVISPLLANLIGDIIDKELEVRGLKFVRYADDFIVLTKKKNKLPEILRTVKDIVEKKLEMELSEDKTELSNFRRGFRFLGYKFHNRYKGISRKSVDKFKDNIRKVTKRNQGINLASIINRVNPVIRGFVNYFQLGNVLRLYRLLDPWIRMRLRAIKFSRKWKTDNWRFKNKRFFKMGLLSMEKEHLKWVKRAG